MSDWNDNVVAEFRANSGKVGGMFEGASLLILHTTGAKTGLIREAPLMYLDDDDRIFIFASKAGADTHPDWYHNLKANTDVDIEIGTQKQSKTARELSGDERNTFFAKQVSAFPQFAEYAAGTDRLIPVIELV